MLCSYVGASFGNLKNNMNFNKVTQLLQQMCFMVLFELPFVPLNWKKKNLDFIKR